MRAMILHPIRFWRDHRLARANASAFLDHELPAALARRIERHEHVCPECRALLESLRALVHGLASLGGPPRVDVVPGVFDAFRRGEPPPRDTG